MMISLYANDQHSEDYTDGVYVFTMHRDRDGRYNSYVGSCYDTAHGRRDSIVGRKVTEGASIKLLDARKATQEDLSKIVNDLFSDLPPIPIPQPPPIHSDGIITVTKAAENDPLNGNQGKPCERRDK